MAIGIVFIIFAFLAFLPSARAFMVAFLGSLLLELFSPFSFGVEIAAIACAGFFMQLVSPMLARDLWRVAALYCFFGITVYSAVKLFLVFFTDSIFATHIGEALARTVANLLEYAALIGIIALLLRVSERFVPSYVVSK